MNSLELTWVGFWTVIVGPFPIQAPPAFRSLVPLSSGVFLCVYVFVCCSLQPRLMTQLNWVVCHTTSYWIWCAIPMHFRPFAYYSKPFDCVTVQAKISGSHDPNPNPQCVVFEASIQVGQHEHTHSKLIITLFSPNLTSIILNSWRLQEKHFHYKKPKIDTANNTWVLRPGNLK